MGRAPCCDKANVKKGPWSPEEDDKLKTYIQEYGTGGNWIALPQKMGLRRCGKSCRLRWLNYLRPNLKHGGFTEEEDAIICSLYISIGSRWSIIAAQLPGRTDNDIKNYWNTRLKKKLLGRRKQSNSNRLPIQEDSSSSFNLQNLSNSALERLELHLHLQNPFSSYYNNPSLWPKFNHRMIQTLNSLNHNQNIPDDQPAAADHPHLLQQVYTSLKEEELVNSVNCLPGTESDIMGDNNGISGFTQAEIDDLLNNRSSSTSVTTGNDQNQMAELIEGGGKDHNNLAWWSSQFEENTTSSPTSWDSATMLHHSEEMYRNFGVAGYSMQ
ncbi:hypothetical protein ACS0TY_032710 [Phlomoides rotata]